MPRSQHMLHLCKSEGSTLLAVLEHHAALGQVNFLQLGDGLLGAPCPRAKSWHGAAYLVGENPPARSVLRKVREKPEAGDRHGQRNHTVHDEKPRQASERHESDVRCETGVTNHFHPGNPPRPPRPVTPAIRKPEKSMAVEPLALRMQARLAISSLRYHEPIMYWRPG